MATAAIVVFVLVSSKTDAVELAQQLVAAPSIIRQTENVVAAVKLGNESCDHAGINAATGTSQQVPLGDPLNVTLVT
jgi:hypothetical protein